MSREVEPTGGGHSYHREFHEMEIRLQEIRHLVELSDPSWTGGQDIERLYRTTHELRLFADLEFTTYFLSYFQKPFECLKEINSLIKTIIKL